MEKFVLIVVFVIVLIFSFVGCEEISFEQVETQVESVEEPEGNKNDWKSDFKKKGFTDEEILSYEVILTNVGITDYHDVEIVENGRMHSIKGKIYDSDSHWLYVTLEDRKIIVVSLYGISEYYKGYNVDLYYDVDGGYVAKYDCEKDVVLPYNE